MNGVCIECLESEITCAVAKSAFASPLINSKAPFKGRCVIASITVPEIRMLSLASLLLLEKVFILNVRQAENEINSDDIAMKTT